MLGNWDKLSHAIAYILKEVVPDVEVYAFGSVLEGRVTGTSDLDLLIAIPDDLNERETHVLLSRMLEDKLGSAAFMIDLHVVNKGRLGKPPYSWWLKRSRRIV